ncbi:hypothetical protein [uncultured Draconibacterium sp.]|uniref:hypothetical protein n=1 Tax=uncultured Draconibacterium sp. TaxID=1573823 RepID=UPI0025FD5F74|nr:hypothetical protein [uncultured Draconibacterium sp.]
MNLKITCSIIFMLFSLFSWAQPTFKPGQDPKPESKKWVAVNYLSDEFEGQIPDLEKWQIEPIGNDWVWDGRPPALFKAENVKVKSGKLQVTVGKLDEVLEKNGKIFTHQGGIVRSIKPGNVGMYFECKMKANATVMSSTFWLMTKYDCYKKLETDIQECVGRTTELTHSWAQGWDSIFHSNAIHRPTECVEKLQLQDAVKLAVPNHQKFYVYAAWWKSPHEIQFFLDGEYQYSINPKVEWDMPAFIHMAIETYDWNPIPAEGGLVESGTHEQRTTLYEWVRTWKLE